MPVKTYWLVEKRVIYTQPIGDISRADALVFVDDMDRLIAEGQQPIHLIQDRRQIGEPYTSFADAAKLLRIAQKLGGWFLVIEKKEPHRALQFMTTIITQAVGIKTRSAFLAFEPLWAFLLINDPTLPASPKLPAELALESKV